MDHDGARRLMAEGVEGRLGPAEERELALHLVTCSECKSLYEGLQHAHPALAAIAVGTPPTRAVDTAVKRATTVLRGEADPGPLGRPPATTTGGPPVGVPTPSQGSPSDTPASLTWARSTGPLIGDDAVESPGVKAPTVETGVETGVERVADEPAAKLGALVEASLVDAPSEKATGPLPRPEPPSGPPVEEEGRREPPSYSPPPLRTKPPTPAPVRRPAEPEVTSKAPEQVRAQPETVRPPREASEPPIIDPDIAPVLSERTSRSPSVDRPVETPVPPGSPVRPPPTRVSSSPIGRQAAVPPSGVAKVDEVEQLLDEDYEAARYGPAPLDDEDRRVGAGPWLAAIAVALALAVLAAVLITRGEGLFGGGGDAPGAEEVRSRVERVFTDLKSVKTTFSVRRLSLYRVGGEAQSLTYGFANGNFSGRIVYDRAEGYRQEVALRVGDRDVERAKIALKPNETRSVLGAAGDLLVENRPPLGPPDGSLRTAVGLMEEAIGVPAQLLITSDNLEVAGSTTQDGRTLYEVHVTVTPDELTRADRIDVFLDAQTFFPAIVRRSISRVNAGVLGPPDVLTDEAISTAFGDRERVTTELVELENTVVDDIILPNDLVLDVPDGSQTQTRDAGFKRITRAQLGEVPFKPLFPRSLPEGFEEQQIAITAEKRGWGPGGRYPAPDGLIHATYFDGRRTIVVTQRRIPSGPFNLEGSPLRTGGLPITVRPFERAEKRFFFGVSPEVAPHAYGFLGNIFAMVSGYASAEELVGILASLAEAPSEAPAATGSPAASPSPTTSP